MKTDFAHWLRKTRVDKGLSQNEAAAELGITGATICRWENGSEPRAVYLLRVAVWAKIAPAKLLEMVALG